MLVDCVIFYQQWLIGEEKMATILIINVALKIRAG